jgi:hypothetical protein
MAVREADLTVVTLTGEQGVPAYGDASVVLPRMHARPGHWPQQKLPPFGESGFLDEWRR